MNKKKIKTYIIFFSIFSFIILWTFLLYVISPSKLVEIIGIENGYFFAFLVASFAGVSTLTATSFYATLITLAIGGLSPLLLSIFAGVGVTIGDSLFYYFGRKGRALASGKAQKKMEKLHAWIEKKPDWAVPLIIFFYVGFVPFANEILTIALALIKYPFRKMIIPLFVANAHFLFWVTYFSISISS